MLDFVIHFNFPDQPKLMLHRSGRVGRNGRPGTAYALIAGDERPYLLDTLLFLPRPLLTLKDIPNGTIDAFDERTSYVGAIPFGVLHAYGMKVHSALQHGDMSTKEACAKRAYGKYSKSRIKPSESSKRRCEDLEVHLDPHPMLIEKKIVEYSQKDKESHALIAEISQGIPKIDRIETAIAGQKQVEDLWEKKKQARNRDRQEKRINTAQSEKFMQVNSPYRDPDFFFDPDDVSEMDSVLLEETEDIKNDGLRVVPEYNKEPSRNKAELDILNIPGDDPHIQKGRRTNIGTDSEEMDDSRKRRFITVWNNRKGRYVKRPVTKTFTKEKYEPTLYRKWKKQHNVGGQDKEDAEQQRSEESEAPLKPVGWKAQRSAMMKEIEAKALKRKERRQRGKVFKIKERKHRPPGMGARRVRRLGEIKKKQKKRGKPRIRKGHLTVSQHRTTRQLF